VVNCAVFSRRVGALIRKCCLISTKGSLLLAAALIQRTRKDASRASLMPEDALRLLDKAVASKLITTTGEGANPALNPSDTA
jgi:hypothetical protein